MLSTTRREVAVSPAPTARLRLQPDHSGPTVLDGGWWPRSADLAAELPGLILALDGRHGRITRVMLRAADWTASRPRQLAFGGPARGRVVWLGWFASMPAGLLTAISASGQRTDLLTVPPHTREPDALAAMELAAQTSNRDHTAALLAAITPAACTSASMAPAGSQPGSREWEDGHRHDREKELNRSRPAAGRRRPRLPAAGLGTS